MFTINAFSLSPNLKEQHFKKIMHLETMLNSTRQEAKKVSRQLSVLWSAGNVTQKELQSVWMAINATQTGLEETLMKVKVNLTKQVISML